MRTVGAAVTVLNATSEPSSFSTIPYGVSPIFPKFIHTTCCADDMTTGPVPHKMRRLLGPIGIQPSPQKYSPSAIAGRGDLVFNPSNFSQEVGLKFSGMPGVAAGADGRLMCPASDISGGHRVIRSSAA